MKRNTSFCRHDPVLPEYICRILRIAVIAAATACILSCSGERAEKASAPLVAPSFSCTPPRPQAKMDLTPFVPLKPGNATLGDVDDMLKKSLRDAGFTDIGNLRLSCTEDGFAVISRLEKIRPDGRSYPEPERWDRENAACDPEEFDLICAIRSLFYVSPGHYRVFVIAVAPISLVPNPQELPLQDTMDELLAGAPSRLPPQMRHKNYTENHGVELLVYQFVKKSHGEYFDSSSSLTALDHLDGSGLKAALEREKP